ncbi:PP2C family protein-serine/threonine phosphatase [Imhoffiella purpurea]|uniref:Serine/threonine protein phosphatase n=1 Tax=Imhoffiella purpurea TaxID=1249627 RepID=W9VB75_9GAMM|nr:protein phosphatase 2C domain-containing protein [Imhoffiella purpurea]EXJ16694.1 Serine/threonine protein phosphatase [Imhoffiella purpurea]
MTPSMSLEWRSGAATDAGRVRTDNQDAFLDRPEAGLWAVADGMGGHQGGGAASRMIVERLSSMGAASLLGVAADSASAIVADINHRLIEEAALSGGGIMGSTLVLILAVGDHCVLLWAGDSRAYRLRDGGLLQLTTDHTQVQEMVDQGLLAPEEAEHHPLSNVLVRAVGGEIDLVLDRRIEALRGGDRYLLCSDGLDKELTSDRIAEILARAEPPEATAQSLVEAACEAGGHDNVTALVVDFSSFGS